MDNSDHTLCTRHSFSLSPVRETREGVPGRQQLPSGAVFSCFFKKRANRAQDLFVMDTQ